MNENVIERIDENYSYLVVNSKKHGLVKSKIDNSLIDKVNEFKWNVYKNRGKNFIFKKTYWYKGEYKLRYLSRHLLDEPKDKFVDHIDGDTCNNTLENLRACSAKENSRNSKTRNTNTSGIKGVNYHKHRKKWVARIGVDYKRIALGYFDTKEEAQVAYEAAATKYFKEFKRKT